MRKEHGEWRGRGEEHIGRKVISQEMKGLVACRGSFVVTMSMERAVTYLQLWLTCMGMEVETGRGEGQVMLGLICHIKEFGNYLLIYEEILKHLCNRSHT